MELKKRWILLIVLLLGLTAALESSPRVVVLRSTLPATTTCPCNPGPYGTSELLGLLRENGMNVTIIAGLAEYATLETDGYDGIVLLVVAADGLDPAYASRALDLLAEHGLPVYIVVLDEYPAEGTQTLLSQAGARLCGADTPLVIARIIPSNPSATAVFVGDGVTLQTGYTSYLAYPGSSFPAMILPEPGPAEIGDYQVLAWVWPSSGENRDQWTPLAARCTGDKGGVLLVADSSIVINEALQSSPVYGEEALRLVRGLTGPGRMLVVIDEAMYLTVQARVAVQVHPSFLLLTAGRVYAGLEEALVESLAGRGLLGALATLAGLAVLLFSWGSSQSSSGVGDKRFRLPVPRPVRPGARMGCAEIMESLRRLGADRLVERIPDPGVREEAWRLYNEILETCEARGVLGSLWRILAGRGERDAYRAYVVLLGLTGVQPLYELPWGGEDGR